MSLPDQEDSQHNNSICLQVGQLSPHLHSINFQNKIQNFPDMISIYINHTDCVLRGFTPINSFAKGKGGGWFENIFTPPIILFNIEGRGATGHWAFWHRDRDIAAYLHFRLLHGL